MTQPAPISFFCSKESSEELKPHKQQNPLRLPDVSRSSIILRDSYTSDRLPDRIGAVVPMVEARSGHVRSEPIARGEHKG